VGEQALVLGASGLVGSELVRQLAADPAYSGITALIRKPLPFTHEKVEQVLVDFDHLERYASSFAVDTVYCCLGTTIRKAGSQEAFRKVDLEYPVTAARLALAAGVKHYAVISSLGADEKSMFFYSRVKGELERALGEIGLPSLSIIRPSLLLGNRQERRTGEQAAAAASRALSFIWSGPLKKYQPVEAGLVAAAMRGAVRQGTPGAFIYHSAELSRLAAVLP
jgi:uncharacterized protein YbjT (DUF2867 family)